MILIKCVFIFFCQQEKPKKPLTIEKKINGEKNGGTRTVRLMKRRSNYPTVDPMTVHHSKKYFKDHTRYTRKSLVSGTVCILLAGAHKGKRVVLLKALKSGLLMVTGKTLFFFLFYFLLFVVIIVIFSFLFMNYNCDDGN